MAVDPRRVLVIGAGPGLGTAVARRFAREGFAVTLAARHPAVPAGELHGADTVVADAAGPHAFRAVLTELAESTAPGVVVYNAAVITTDNILGAGTDHLLHAYAVDVLGAVIAAQVFTPAMRRARSGTFLATGGNPDPSHASLSLGKAALRAAVALMHDELKADGVHAGSVTVGGTITPGTPFDPDRIAETYWELHTQPADAWAAETYFEG